jgi:transglutaminase-like putative cysteine protease
VFDKPRVAAPAKVALRRGGWQMSAALFLEILACSIALVGLVQGHQWWLALVGTAALLLVVPALLRSAGLAPWLAAIIDVGVFAVVIQLFFTSSASFGDLFRAALYAIQAEHVPASPLHELMFFIVLFGGAMAILLDLLAVVLRIPAITAVVIAGVLVVPAVLQPDGLSLIALGAGAAAWFVVLEADGRLRFGSRGSGPLALAVGASVTLLSVVVATTAPGFVEEGRPAHAGTVSVGNTVNPLIDLGADLRQPVAADVLRYTSNTKTPLYLQLTTLDTVNGTDWTHTPGSITSVRGTTRLPGAPGLDPALGISAPSYTTKITVQNLSSIWLPAPYPATRLSGAKTATSYQQSDLTIYAQGGDQSGQTYTVTSLDLEPTVRQLRALGGFPSPAEFEPVQADLQLPLDVPPIITDTARSIADGAGSSSEIDLAMALQSFFQDSAQGFTYSTNTPDSIDGASLAIIAEFLDKREGYCVHFASAMAVLARVLGIPSRIAIGYLPGTAVGTADGRTTYQVRSTQLHAWPQLYFPNVGWLNFEPTVSRGAPPLYSVDLGSSDDPQGSTPSPTTASTTAPPAAVAPTALPTAQAEAPANATAQQHGVPTALGVLVILAILLAPMAARLIRRRSRIGKLREEGEPASLAWDEIRDTARDLGFSLSRAETPRAFAARLREQWRPDAAVQRDLDEILARLEISEYGPPRPWDRYFELAETTERAVAGLRAARPASARLTALFVPASLFTPLAERAAGIQRTLT